MRVLNWTQSPKLPIPTQTHVSTRIQYTLNRILPADSALLLGHTFSLLTGLGILYSSYSFHFWTSFQVLVAILTHQLTPIELNQRRHRPWAPPCGGASHHNRRVLSPRCLQRCTGETWLSGTALNVAHSVHTAAQVKEEPELLGRIYAKQAGGL